MSRLYTRSDSRGITQIADSIRNGFGLPTMNLPLLPKVIRFGQEPIIYLSTEQKCSSATIKLNRKDF